MEPMKYRILGVGVTDATEEEVLEYIKRRLKRGGEKWYIVTPNPEIIVKGYKNIAFRRILNSASLALPDGIGVIWAGNILGKKFKERITGVSTVENLCKMANDFGFTVGFIGGGPKIADRTAECLQKKYPRLRVVFARSTLPHRLLTSPKTPMIDILFVAFGAPKQEIWISENLRKTPVRMAMSVGGAFDYLSGNVQRAPQWVQDLGFEWLFRLLRQPWRLKRQLSLIEFALLVFKERFSP